jgi:hypothetical protein
LGLLTYPDVIRGGNPLSNISVTQQCAEFNACNPVPVTLGPIGLAIDDAYTSFAYQDIQQWMVDPLWQMPVVPCDERDDKEYRVDDGSCGASGDEIAAAAAAALDDKEIVWILPPYEEARCVLPEIDGEAAPALPGGISLGCVNTGTDTAPNWVGPECGEPAQGSMFCPWVVWLNQVTFNCDDVVDFDP